MRSLLALVVTIGTVLPATALGDARINYLSRQLETGKDARVKAQAALMLGSSNDPSAVRALCTGVRDSSEVVRGAAAKGLGELGEVAGLDCLKSAINDPDATAKAAIGRAYKELEAIKNRKPELYIALAPIADKAGVPPELVKLAEDRLKAKLQRVGALIAPNNEAKNEAKSVLKQKRLKGYLLMPELHSLPGGGMKLHMLCFTYPDRALLGEVNVKGSGGGPSDLIRALAPKIIEEAADTFDWSS